MGSYRNQVTPSARHCRRLSFSVSVVTGCAIDSTYLETYELFDVGMFELDMQLVM